MHSLTVVFGHVHSLTVVFGYVHSLMLSLLNEKHDLDVIPSALSDWLSGSSPAVIGWSHQPWAACEVCLLIRYRGDEV